MDWHSGVTVLTSTPASEIEERVLSTDADRLLEWSDRVLTAERLQDVFRD